MKRVAWDKFIERGDNRVARTNAPGAKDHIGGPCARDHVDAVRHHWSRQVSDPSFVYREVQDLLAPKEENSLRRNPGEDLQQ